MSTPATTALTPWQIARTEGEGGTGNWRALRRTVAQLEFAADVWRSELGGIQKPWLCWNVNENWCMLQQRLVLDAGWTPVVGWDPNSSCGPPQQLVAGAVAIDFNKHLRFPVLFPHVPIELVHLWADRLAFWHSDMLLPRTKMRRAVRVFNDLADGEVAAVFSFSGLRNLLLPNHHRYWEVLGCTTAGASADMYTTGCGWWRNWDRHHVNAPKEEALLEKRSRAHQDHGGGVLWWRKHHQGKVRSISERFVVEGHFSITSRKNYVKAPSKSDEMDINFDLKAIAKRLDILDLME